MSSIARVVVLLVALLVASVQAADLHGLQTTSLQVEGHLSGESQLGALRATDARDGQITGATGLYFQLQAETLRVETDARPVLAVAGAHVPGEVQVEERTYVGAELRAVDSHPQHSLVVLPAGPASVLVKATNTGMVPEPAGRVVAEHYVDPGRNAMAADVPAAVQMGGLTDAHVEVRGDLVLVVWAWTFHVHEAGAVVEYRTGHHSNQGVDAPGVGRVAGIGEDVQAYIHATNATLTFLPGAAADNVDLFVLQPLVQGVTKLQATTATGHLGSTLLLSEDLELRGDAMAVALDHARSGLLEVDVTGVQSYRVGEAPLAALTAPAEAAVPAYAYALLAVAALVGIVLLARQATAPRRLALGHRLAKKGHLRLACTVLRLHLRRSPECVTGLLLLAEAQGRRGRLKAELAVRSRAAELLVDDDWVHNARRILHLHMRLGQEEAALEWFQACRLTDPGLVQELLAEPLFRNLGQSLRVRAQSMIGWEDPTGA